MGDGTRDGVVICEDWVKWAVSSYGADDVWIRNEVVPYLTSDQVDRLIK